jgi:hypothetical protein
MNLDKLLNSGFTPGPWRYEPRDQSINGKAPDDRWHYVGMIRGWGEYTGRRGMKHGDAVTLQNANGELSAAAPDLLHYAKELEDKLALLEEYMGYMDRPDAESWITRKESV